MDCPVCKVDLQMADRQGIEIDYCPKCRGVWLDRGELDKLIERSTAFAGGGGPPPGRPDDRDRDRGRGYEDSDRGRGYEPQRYPHKKKESFWGELFDFG